MGAAECDAERSLVVHERGGGRRFPSSGVDQPARAGPRLLDPRRRGPSSGIVARSLRRVRRGPASVPPPPGGPACQRTGRVILRGDGARSLRPDVPVELPLAQAALAFARRHHGEQAARIRPAPFILHPLEVAALVLRAAVADLVCKLSEDPAIPSWEARNGGPAPTHARGRNGRRRVYAAGKVAKVRELRAQLSRGAAQAEEPHLRRRLEHYRLSLLGLEEVAPEHPLVGQLRFEPEALQALPPAPART